MSIGLDELSPEHLKKENIKDNQDDDQAPVIGETAPVIQPLSDDAKPAVDGFQLPTGYLDGNGEVHTDVVLSELSGEDEDLLTARKMSMPLRMQKIMENRIESIGSYRKGCPDWSNIVRSLVATDRVFLMIKIRIISLGHLFSFKSKCTDEDCGNYSSQTVSLNDFNIKGLPDPTKRAWSGTLPNSKFTYSAKVQTGREESKIDKIKNQKDLLSLAMMARLTELNDKSPVTLDMLKRLGFADRQFLRDEFQKHEGDIDNDVDVECPHCGYEYKTTIDIGDVSFFFPSATSKH